MGGKGEGGFLTLLVPPLHILTFKTPIESMSHKKLFGPFPGALLIILLIKFLLGAIVSMTHSCCKTK